MFKQDKNVFSVFVLILFVALSIHANAQDSEEIEFYRNLPVNEHLMSANLKINKLIQDAESMDNPDKLEKFTEADNLLWEAIRKYEFYRTGRMKDTWRPPGPDSPLEKSPLSLLEHLRIAHKKALQSKTSMMIADRQYTQKEREQYNSLKEALDFMTKAITKIEDIRDWSLYEDLEKDISFEAPLDYKPNTTRKPIPQAASRTVRRKISLPNKLGRKEDVN